MLERLKQTVGRVEVEGKPNGTAFLVDRKHVATALHVLDGHAQVKLTFVEWDRGDRERTARRTWRHPAGHDIAILELDRACPDTVEPLPWAATTPALNAQWLTFGFPAEVVAGHPLSSNNERVSDPRRLVDAWDLRVFQLLTLAGRYDLAGFSGAPCVIGDAIVGVITSQLRRTIDGSETCESRPSLDTLFALPITLLVPSGIVPPNPEAFAGDAKASVVSMLLRAIDRLDQQRETLVERALVAQRLREKFRVVVHVVWRRENSVGEKLAHAVYCRFTRSDLAQTSPGLRIPTFLYDQPAFLTDEEPLPIDRARVEHTLIVILRDDRMVIEESWRECMERIVAAADGDPAATMIVPVEIGAAKPAGQFGARRIIELPADAAATRLLLALEARILSKLTDRPGGPRDRKPVQLFLSYARGDGKAQAEEIKQLADATPGVDALLDDAALAPGDRIDELPRRIAGRVLVAFVTRQYTSRPWCRLELLTAKQIGAPVVVVNSQPGDLPRAFPYLGNVPWIEWHSTRARDDILEAAAFEMLRDRYARIQLEDQALLFERLRDSHIVSRPPELLDVIAGGSLAKIERGIVLHPDPPMSEEEKAVMGRVAPAIELLSPGEVMAEDHLFQGAEDDPLPIALSASPSDLTAPGVMGLHFDDAWLDLARMLLLGGATLAFGGDLREGGLTDVLLELAEQRAAVERREKRKRTAPIRSYLAWPAFLELDDAREARLIEYIRFRRLVPPVSTVAVFPTSKLLPTTPDARYLWSLSMTRMRRTVRDSVRALVSLGGRTSGFAGRYAGVVEEVLLAIAAGRPIFLLGGFGGAAAAVGEALLGKTPRTLTAAVQLSQREEREFVAHYNERIGNDEGADDRAPIDHDAVVETLRSRGLPGLNNGLSEADNRLLLSSPSMQEVSPVLLKGLRGLLPRANQS